MGKSVPALGPAKRFAFVRSYDDKPKRRLLESAVNQVVSQRMVKQMRWSQRGAHLLLQVRTRVLNNELRETFGRWYPEMKPDQASRENWQRNERRLMVHGGRPAAASIPSLSRTSSE